MSELKPKKTPLKFKGQKPLAATGKRFYSEVVTVEKQNN